MHTLTHSCTHSCKHALSHSQSLPGSPTHTHTLPHRSSSPSQLPQLPYSKGPVPHACPMLGTGQGQARENLGPCSQGTWLRRTLRGHTLLASTSCVIVGSSMADSPVEENRAWDRQGSPRSQAPARSPHRTHRAPTKGPECSRRPGAATHPVYPLSLPRN